MITLFFTPVSSQADDYVSLYSYGQTISYCSQSPCGGAENCEENSYPCSVDYPYKYTNTLAGFKDIYNLNDPKILCGLDVAGIDECASEEKYLALTLSTLSNYNNYISVFPDTFRIFIPPGTIRRQVVFYMPLDALEGVVVRYQQPPDCDCRQYVYFDDVPWDNPHTSLQTMAERDVYLQNAGGLISALPTFSLQAPMIQEESGWLYIRKLPFTSSRIIKITVNLKMNIPSFLDWYNNGAVWDVVGDPRVNPADTDDDEDVDGKDLAFFIEMFQLGSNPVSVEIFASSFGGQ